MAFIKCRKKTIFFVDFAIRLSNGQLNLLVSLSNKIVLHGFFF